MEGTVDWESIENATYGFANYSDEDYYTAIHEEYSDDMEDEGRHMVLPVRTMLFLLFGLCAGVPALAWALRSLSRHLQTGGKISVFVVNLLLNAALELFLIPFLLVLLYDRASPERLNVVFNTFLASRLCGMCFHQLVALERAVCVSHVFCCSRLLSPCCSIPICLAVWICGATVDIDRPLRVHLLMPLTVVAASITCVLTLQTLCSHADPPARRHTARGRELRVLAVSMGTLWVLYAPFMVWWCVSFYRSWGTPGFVVEMCFCIMSFRAVADSLLCVLVCREDPDPASASTGIELNTVQASD